MPTPSVREHPEWLVLSPNGTPTTGEVLRGRAYRLAWMRPARRPGYTDQWLTSDHGVRGPLRAWTRALASEGRTVPRMRAAFEPIQWRELSPGMTTILQEAAAGRATIVPWTIEQYRKAIEMGFVPEDASVELLDGFIIRKDRAKAGEDPTTIGDRHRVAVVRLAHSAPLFEPHRCFLQTQQPVSLPPSSEPEPDGAVVRGHIDDYLDGPPAAADLFCVIEVADSSLALDLGPKLKTYATARIPQYIVVDLVNDRVLVHEEPAGESYSREKSFARGDTLRISAGAGIVTMAAGRLLP